MCGRTRCRMSQGELEEKTGAPLENGQGRSAYTPRENVHPGQALPVLQNREGTRVLRSMTWGLVPAFHKKGQRFDFFRMFNARSETLMQKGIFKRLLKRRSKRCVVVVDGFYEWTTDAQKQKQPWYLHGPDGQPLFMAAVCDKWYSEKPAEKSKAEEVADMAGAGREEPFTLETCSIITTEIVDDLKWLHTRMPVLLWGSQVDEWLALGDKEVDYAEGDPHGDYFAEDSMQRTVSELLTPKTGLQWYPVSKKMNNMSYEDDDCAVEVKLAPAPKKITAFFGSPKKQGAVEGKTSGKRARTPEKEDDSNESAETPELKKLKVGKQEEAQATPATPSSARQQKSSASPGSRKRRSKAGATPSKETIANFFAPRRKPA